MRPRDAPAQPGRGSGPQVAPEAAERSEPGVTVTDVIDCLGQRCPLPVIALARRLPQLPVGAVLRVLADDPAAANDIPAWCRLRGQEYLGPAGEHGYEVRRVR
jgi:tRNA 2-thiouridine synthesizing protein A